MRVALLVPDPADDLYAPYAAPFLAGYVEALAGAGVEGIGVPWNAAPPAGLAGAVPLLAWGYHRDPPGWDRALDRWEAATRLVNAPGVLRWNTRKTYLLDLERAGVDIVPTRFAARADADALADAARAFGTGDLVVKPRISGGGYRTYRIRPGEAPPEVVEDAMIQPFQPAVGGDGEQSVLFLGGRFSHAVRKVAAAGEFRVQQAYGGVFTRFAPPADLAEAAARVMAAAPAPPVYARIDLVRGGDGRPLLMELEAIEPDLYLSLAPEAGPAWAAAIRDALR